MNHSEDAFGAWIGKTDAAPANNPEWPKSGVAIEGDFSGIQRFVLRPVPGAGGAARRLRARSFRVLALTRLVADAVEKRFAQSRARLFYAAGGRFLVVAHRCAEWQKLLAAVQQELDEDLLATYRGELVFHLAGAEFSDGKIPVAKLGEAMELRKFRPLGSILQGAKGWCSERFTLKSLDHGRCDGCGSTAKIHEEESEEERLCQTCVDDREMGKQLLSGGLIGLKRSPTGSIRLRGERWALAAAGSIEISHIEHIPLSDGRLADFDELAERAMGRPYLGYLRIDADRVGEQFRRLEGDPYRTWGLSALLDRAFSEGVTRLLGSRFPNLYPVYGGGDDLFLIGPWNEALEFASVWRAEFRALTQGKLNFSAGMVLAKPRQHVLTKAEEAASELEDEAKERGRNRISALGDTIEWSDFDEVYAAAKQLAALHGTGKIKSAFLHALVYLHDQYREGDKRWHSRLSYHVERNLGGQAQSFARSAFLAPGHLWCRAGFIGRYAMLASRERAADSAVDQESNDGRYGRGPAQGRGARVKSRRA